MSGEGRPVTTDARQPQFQCGAGEVIPITPTEAPGRSRSRRRRVTASDGSGYRVGRDGHVSARLFPHGNTPKAQHTQSSGKRPAISATRPKISRNRSHLDVGGADNSSEPPPALLTTSTSGDLGGLLCEPLIATAAARSLTASSQGHAKQGVPQDVRSFSEPFIRQSGGHRTRPTSAMTPATTARWRDNHARGSESLLTTPQSAEQQNRKSGAMRIPQIV